MSDRTYQQIERGTQEGGRADGEINGWKEKESWWETSFSTDSDGRNSQKKTFFWGGGGLKKIKDMRPAEKYWVMRAPTITRGPNVVQKIDKEEQTFRVAGNNIQHIEEESPEIRIYNTQNRKMKNPAVVQLQKRSLTLQEVQEASRHLMLT